MSEKPEVGAGDVVIQLGGKDYILRPSLSACTILSKDGGLQGMVRRCLHLEQAAIIMVIEAGLGRSSRDMPKLVYETGLRNLNGPCITFLTNVANGGRPVKEDEDAGDPPLADQKDTLV